MSPSNSPDLRKVGCGVFDRDGRDDVHGGPGRTKRAHELLITGGCAGASLNTYK